MRLSYLNRLKRSKAWSALANYLKSRRENIEEFEAQKPEVTATTSRLEDYLQQVASLMWASIKPWNQPDDLPREGWAVAAFEVQTIRTPSSEVYAKLWSTPITSKTGRTVGFLISEIARLRMNHLVLSMAKSPYLPNFRALYPSVSIDVASVQLDTMIHSRVLDLRTSEDPAIREFFSSRHWSDALNHILDTWDTVYQRPLTATMRATEWALSHRESYWTQGSCTTPSARIEDHASLSRDTMVQNLTIALAAVVSYFVQEYNGKSKEN